MIARISKLHKDELVRGGTILFALLVVFNILNYIYQISMARMLGPASFGILAALMNVIYILNIPGEAIQTIISRYTTTFTTRNEQGKLKDLLLRSMNKGFFFACIMYLIFIPVGYALSYFLHTEFWLILLAGLYIFSILLVPTLRGILQGKKQFVALGTNISLEAFFKVILAFVMVTFGLQVYGAIGAVIAAGFVTFLFAFALMKPVLKASRESVDFKDIYRYNLPVLISMISIVLMFSLDVIFARAYFSPELAGQYAFVSLIGKVILFMSTSVGKAMLPLSSEAFEKGTKPTSLFKKSLLIICAISFSALILYGLFPAQIIQLVSLGSKQYLGASNILLLLGLGATCISFANLIVLYRLSMNRMGKASYALLFFVLLQVILFVCFHATIVEFATSFFVSTLLMFLFTLFLLKK